MKYIRTLQHSFSLQRCLNLSACSVVQHMSHVHIITCSAAAIYCSEGRPSSGRLRAVLCLRTRSPQARSRYEITCLIPTIRTYLHTQIPNHFKSLVRAHQQTRPEASLKRENHKHPLRGKTTSSPQEDSLQTTDEQTALRRADHQRL